MNDEQFARFYAQTAQALTGRLLLVTRDLDEARDCVQEAYARAWQRWPALHRDGEDPVGWMRTVAWRIAVSGFRRRKAHARAIRRHGPLADLNEPSADVLAVRSALATLPHGHRAALVLHYYEGLSVAEIAVVLGLSEGGVKSRLSRGRTALLPLVADPQEPRHHTTGTPRSAS